MFEVSVIISTYKRFKKIQDCLEILLEQDLKNYEILIIDQSKNKKTEEVIKKMNNPQIKFFKMANYGLARARNYGIRMAKGEILAFTDDDCLPAKNWLKEIYESFQKRKDIMALFGRTLPYQPKKHKGLICLATFEKEKERVFNFPCKHWEIGYGNNMAFRKEVFEKVGKFKEWLGAGSVSFACEDGEFAYRVLKRGYKILFQPKAIIYHNRWLPPRSGEYKKQMKRYRCGEVAFYGFYALQGCQLSQEVVKGFLKEAVRRSCLKVGKTIKNLSFHFLWDLLSDLYYDIRGLLIAFWFAKLQSNKTSFFSGPLKHDKEEKVSEYKIKNV